MCGRESFPKASYTTEIPDVTEDPEVSEIPEASSGGPILPGRKHVYEPGYLDVSSVWF